MGNTQLEGRALVRIDLEGENPIRASALAYDLDAHRRILLMQRESLDKQSSRMNAQQKQMLLRSQQQLEDSAKIIEARRQLPATRRYTFYLDPQLHYAVRRLDQYYGTDTLLSRSDCTQFEQIPGRACGCRKKWKPNCTSLTPCRGPFSKIPSSRSSQLFRR